MDQIVDLLAFIITLKASVIDFALSTHCHLSVIQKDIEYSFNDLGGIHVPAKHL